MKLSTDRILTTHTGSLPRSQKLSKLLVRRDNEKRINTTELKTEIKKNLDSVIKLQAKHGVDVGNDGETPRVGFSTYTMERMVKGFGGASQRKPALDMIKFPKYADFFKRQIGQSEELARVWNAPQAIGEIEYDPKLTDAKFESEVFQSALKRTKVKFADTFMSAATPGIMSLTMLRAPKNKAYKDDEAYVMALAREMKKEYEFVVSQGYVLQLDAPDLAMERVIHYGDKPLKVFLDRVALHIEAINVAIADIPKDKVRLHVCWGNWNGPHQDDVPAETLLPLLLKAKVGGLSIPLGNPRHEHETGVFKAMPKDMVFIPGVIDVTTNYLEHPQVVANRLIEAVKVIGDRERVLGGTDCGFGTFASYEFIGEDIVWAKLAALRDGAKLASDALWGRKKAA